ncbi:rifin PIR protein,putative [Plasmodium sp. DRC-Itaito]|nr:rifin PIR protein,putative [Plasmodium sp. DRC-Itaito]
MKVHYFNILLFDLPLNILVYNQRNHNITTFHTPKISTTRLLCECELYAPANYDNDAEMKEVMQQFEDRTSERLREYDDRMKTTRQKCKEQCDKEMQKIILKDKLEKELMDKFVTLDTDIQSDAIPTCICEKSIATKVEKGCLRCGYGLGTVAPTVGLLGTVAINKWTSVATASAIDFATKAGIKAGIATVIAKIKEMSIFSIALQDVDWSNFITESYFRTVDGLVKAIKNAISSTGKTCEAKTADPTVCSVLPKGEATFGPAVKAGQDAAAATTESVQTTTLGKVATTSYEGYATVGYSVLAIIIIILIMVIIYLILRRRRKKKMKKKLQYIKLLEE